MRDGQDDGRGFLFSIYRYIDARLGAVHDLLDQDDVFIVMSDHGIRTAMGAFEPSATIFVDPPPAAGGCPEGEACLQVRFEGEAANVVPSVTHVPGDQLAGVSRTQLHTGPCDLGIQSRGELQRLSQLHTILC